MEINYSGLETEILGALENNPVWVLSTSWNGYVTSRPMSIIHIGLTVYFQTNACYIKHEQMQLNQRVSLCCQNISIEGDAEAIGDWHDENNAPILELYKRRHMGSYNKYGTMPGQIVYKVIPTKIKLWKYEDGEPFREVLLVNERRAERLAFM